MTTACMGGWCALREGCPHYRAESVDPIERICEPGKDGQLRRIPIATPTPQEQVA